MPCVWISLVLTFVKIKDHETIFVCFALSLVYIPCLHLSQFGQVDVCFWWTFCAWMDSLVSVFLGFLQ